MPKLNPDWDLVDAQDYVEPEAEDKDVQGAGCYRVARRALYVVLVLFLALVAHSCFSHGSEDRSNYDKYPYRLND